MFVLEKDYNSAVQILSAGVEFAYMAGANYTKMLFLLSKTMLFLLERKFADANPILHQTGPMIENWLQQNAHQKESVAKQQKEYLQIFFLVLQVRYLRFFHTYANQSLTSLILFFTRFVIILWLVKLNRSRRF